MSDFQSQQQEVHRRFYLKKTRPESQSKTNPNEEVMKNFYQVTADELARLPEDFTRLKNRRGANVYTWTDTMAVSGRDKNGNVITGEIERPLFGLKIEDRLDIMRLCAPVLGIVTSRANKISGLNWKVTYKRKDEDRLVTMLKTYHQIWKEYEKEDTVRGIVVRTTMFRYVKNELPDIKWDMSNFNGALSRWNKKLKNKHEDISTEIEDWLRLPSQGEDFETFIKKWVQDCMIHGCYGVYKESDKRTNRIDNFYLLPGGSVIPFHSKYVGGPKAFVQMIAGMDVKVYFEDEILFGSYIPSSATGYGYIPLEALINNIAETLLFDRYAAERADGTSPPQKILALGNQSPFGSFNNAEGMPLDAGEQKRVEMKVNEMRKEGIAVLTGYTDATSIDLSRDNLYQVENERSKNIIRSMAMVYNMSNMEVNQTDSEGTSGRTTSESQERIEREKGVYPKVRMFENMINYGIVPFRYGTNYIFNFDTGLSDKETLQLEQMMMQTQTYTKNEIRMKRGDDPTDDPNDDKLTPGQGQETGQSEMSPMFTKEV